MPLVPTLLDRIDAWVSVSLADNRASLLRTYIVTRNTGSVDLSVWASGILSFTANRLSPVMGSGDYLLSVTTNLKKTDGQTDTYTISDAPLSLSGQGNPLPPNVTALSSFRPGTPKPRHVSRLYWPFVSSNFLGSDTGMTPAGQATVQGQAELFLFTLDFGGSGYAIRARNAIVTKATQEWEYLTAVETSFFFATQKRRLRGSQKASWEP